MRYVGEAGRWYDAGRADAQTGRKPRSVLDPGDELPERFGSAYNAGYRAADGPWPFVFGWLDNRESELVR